MSNWISITKASLYDSKAAALIDAADSVQLGAGQVARSTDVIADVVAEIRRKVARVTVLDQDITKIPGGLKNCAVDIIVARLKIALEQDLTQDERDGLKRRDQELRDVRDGKDFVDPPDNPATEAFEQAQPAPSFGDFKHRRKNREDG
jgi:hypothetical protein